MSDGLLSTEKMLGQRIRELRIKRGRSQKTLAEMCHLSESAIRNYELGNRTPSDDILHDIADALHVNYYTLAEPSFETPDGVMHILFQLEGFYGLRPVEVNGKACLAVDMSRNLSGDVLKLQEMLDEWLEAKRKLEAGAWKEKKYDKWQSRFPNGQKPGTSQNEASQRRGGSRKPKK